MKIILHHAPDNASLIIRLALEHLGTPYTAQLVDRKMRAQTQPAYRKLNPHGLIPVLETPQGPIFETGAILLWLTDAHVGLGPLSADPKRADFLKWLFFIANTLHPSLRMIFYPDQYTSDDPHHHAALRRTVQTALRAHLAQVELRAGDAPLPRALQFYLAPLLRWCALYPKGADHSWFSLADTPHLHAMCLAIEDLPCTKIAQAAEGLGPTPFTDPHYPTPPEGSAT